MDHMEFLGDTLEKIAFEKAGILKPGVPCAVGAGVPEVGDRSDRFVRSHAELAAEPIVSGITFARDMQAEADPPSILQSQRQQSLHFRR